MRRTVSQRRNRTEGWLTQVQVRNESGCLAQRDGCTAGDIGFIRLGPADISLSASQRPFTSHGTLAPSPQTAGQSQKGLPPQTSFPISRASVDDSLRCSEARSWTTRGYTYRISPVDRTTRPTSSFMPPAWLTPGLVVPTSRMQALKMLTNHATPIQEPPRRMGLGGSGRSLRSCRKPLTQA